MAYGIEGASFGRRRAAAVARPFRRAAPASAFDPRRSPAPAPRPRPAVESSFPEIDCVRHLLPLGFAEVAEWRSVQVGVGADRVLVTAGHIAEETYLRALANSLGVTFDPLDATERGACPLPDQRFAQASVTGILPLRSEGELTWVIAPRGLAARNLVRLLRWRPALCSRIRLTSAERLASYVAWYGMNAIGRGAADTLRVRQPFYSAAAPPGSLVVPFLMLAALVVGALMAPAATTTVIGVGLAAFFLAWIAFRLASAFAPQPGVARLIRIPDDRLPVFTVIVALYHEAEVVEGLAKALRKLDYPPEKLDIKLVLEPDDDVTLAAVARLRLGAPFEVVIAPDIGPRTKPKALNVALALARGAFTSVFDAEDRPEPDQLRRALEAFDADDRLACVQARLTIDNTDDGWLARLFTAEYAGLFDVFLPVIAKRRLPVPLGGSSNHFRTAALRAVGGWDPYNVTEDADLGMRLSRHGYETAMIASTTYEEAPARLVPWLKQRTRWFKGWIQTWLVHMREPRRLVRELGLGGFVAFQLLVGGTVLTALIHGVFAILLAIGWLGGPFAIADPMTTVPGSLYAATLVAGYLTSGLLGAIGLARRGLAATSWWLLLMPLHWVLLSLAAWRAIVQLVRDPYRWEKTEHGQAVTSRLSPPAEQREQTLRYTAADRQPRPRPSAPR